VLSQKHAKTGSAHSEVTSFGKEHQALIFGPPETGLTCDDGRTQDAVNHYKLGRKRNQLLNTRQKRQSIL
jgi:hypothetical protein